VLTFIRHSERSVFAQISRLEYVHSHLFVHRDIKPSNFLIGVGGYCDEINIIDFGLAKQYMDRDTHAHIPCRTGYALTGTTAFASINNHHGLEQSRRDDLESLAYVLIYFLRGSLPWYGNAKRKKTPGLLATRNSKVNSPTNVLCDSLPKEFAILLNYARALRHDERPDYKYLRNLFSDLLQREGHEHDYVFDWQYTSRNNVVANTETELIKHVTKEDSQPLRRV
jgi:casein kinase I family protein HRR25